MLAIGKFSETSRREPLEGTGHGARNRSRTRLLGRRCLRAVRHAARVLSDEKTGTIPAHIIIVTTLIVCFFFALTKAALAGQTPVLTASGQTLTWTGGTRQFVVESKPPTAFVTIEGHTYKPPVEAGATVSFRVRPKASPNRWSNTVQIAYPPEEKEPPKEEEPPPSNTAGRVLYRLNAASYYDPFAGNTAFLQAHIDRVLGYGAFAWSHYASLVPTVCYEDAYTRFGAHTLNPTHRAEYIASVKEDIAHGCAGIFSDDIEWEGSGQHEVGTDAEVLALIEAVKNAIGTKINQVNTQWVDLWPRIKSGDPEVLKSLLYTNHNDKEFGVNSASGINSPSSFADYLAYVDNLHGRGIHIDQADSEPGNVYEVATYLLSNDGGDYIGSHITPETWVALYDTNIGAALGPREQVGSAYRRRFTGGTVYVNPPGATTTTIDGHTLGARSGLIG